MEKGGGGDKYKLTYFDGIRGRAEMVKIMFHLSKVEYEMVKITFEEWAPLKKDFPLGQLPVLDTEEGQIAQSTAIANFVANRLGYLPEGDWNRAVADSLVVSLNDVIATLGWKYHIYAIYKFIEPPGEKEVEEAKQLCLETVNKTLNYIESLSDKESKYIFGDKITLPDIALFTVMEYCWAAFPGHDNGSDWFKKWLDNFRSNSEIQNYLSIREPSRFGT